MKPLNCNVFVWAGAKEYTCEIVFYPSGTLIFTARPYQPECKRDDWYITKTLDYSSANKVVEKKPKSLSRVIIDADK